MDSAPAWSQPDSNLADFEPQTPSQSTANSLGSGVSGNKRGVAGDAGNNEYRSNAKNPGSISRFWQLRSGDLRGKYPDATDSDQYRGTYLTTMPQFTWTDPDGFTQAGYEILLNKQAGDSGGQWSIGHQMCRAGTQTSLTIPSREFSGDRGITDLLFR